MNDHLIIIPGNTIRMESRYFQGSLICMFQIIRMEQQLIIGGKASKIEKFPNNLVDKEFLFVIIEIYSICWQLSVR